MSVALNLPPQRLGPWEWPGGHRPDRCAHLCGVPVDEFSDHLCAVETARKRALAAS